MIKLANASTSNACQEKQVKICDYYDKNWNYILRPSSQLANNIAKTAKEICENDYVGYSQEYRLTLLHTLKAHNWKINEIKSYVYCDCSSFVGTVLNTNWINVNTACLTTSTMMNELPKFGFQAIKFTGKSQLLKGDVLLAIGCHTVIVVESDNTSSEVYNKTIDGVVKLQDKNSYLNVREFPNTYSKVVGALKDGEKVKVISETNEWYKINIGYCFKKYIVT